MGYTLCTPVEAEKLTTIMEPGNLENKFAVAVIKKEVLVGHLPEGKTGRFAKLFSTFYDPVTIILLLCRSKWQGNNTRQWKGDESSMQVAFLSQGEFLKCTEVSSL